MQLPIRSCLFFPFGQASPVPLRRHYPCFPLRESLPNCRFKASSASRVAQGAERGQFKFRPFFQALSLLIFLAKKFAKFSAATRLPLACIKFSATTRLLLGGKLCRKAAVMRGSFNSDMPFAHRRPLLSLFTSSVLAARSAPRKPFCPTFILA